MRTPSGDWGGLSAGVAGLQRRAVSYPSFKGALMAIHSNSKCDKEAQAAAHNRGRNDVHP
jgi:hypothetical protein